MTKWLGRNTSTWSYHHLQKARLCWTNEVNTNRDIQKVVTVLEAKRFPLEILLRNKTEWSKTCARELSNTGPLDPQTPISTKNLEWKHHRGHRPTEMVTIEQLATRVNQGRSPRCWKNCGETCQRRILEKKHLKIEHRIKQPSPNRINQVYHQSIGARIELQPKPTSIDLKI